MPHGLGSARDFGIEPTPEPSLTEEELAVNQAFFQPEEPGQEILGPEDDVSWDIANEGEGAPEGPFNEDDAASAQELLNYLAMMQPQYVVTPKDLIELFDSALISLEEARAFLVSKGVITE